MCFCPDLFTFEAEFNFAKRLSPQSLHLFLAGAVACGASAEDWFGVNSCQGK